MPEWVGQCVDEVFGLELEALREAADYPTRRLQELDRTSMRGVLTHALAVRACGVVCRFCAGLPEPGDPAAATHVLRATFARLLLGAHSFATTGRDPESALVHRVAAAR